MDSSFEAPNKTQSSFFNSFLQLPHTTPVHSHGNLFSSLSLFFAEKKKWKWNFQQTSSSPRIELWVGERAAKKNLSSSIAKWQILNLCKIQPSPLITTRRQWWYSLSSSHLRSMFVRKMSFPHSESVVSLPKKKVTGSVQFNQMYLFSFSQKKISHTLSPTHKIHPQLFFPPSSPRPPNFRPFPLTLDAALLLRQKAAAHSQQQQHRKFHPSHSTLLVLFS